MTAARLVSGVHVKELKNLIFVMKYIFSLLPQFQKRLQTILSGGEFLHRAACGV